jgi:hypothetical protein
VDDTFRITTSNTNDAPTLTGVDNVTFLENTVPAAAQLIDSSVLLDDVDATSYNGGNLTVSYSAGGGVEDSISVRNQGSGVGQIGFDGTTVSYAGTAIGTITTNGAAGTNLAIAFNSNATPAAVDALLENLTYANNSNNPTASRTLNISVNDGSASVAAASVVTVTAQGEVPTDISAIAATVLSTPYSYDFEGTTSGFQLYVGTGISSSSAYGATSGTSALLMQGTTNSGFDIADNFVAGLAEGSAYRFSYSARTVSVTANPVVLGFQNGAGDQNGFITTAPTLVDTWQNYSSDNIWNGDRTTLFAMFSTTDFLIDNMKIERIDSVGFKVMENSVAGTLVANLTATDADAGDSFTFAVTGGATDKFEVTGGNQLVVKAGANLDYETATGHAITVQVTDAAGFTYSKGITVTVADHNPGYYGDATDATLSSTENAAIWGGIGNELILGSNFLDQIYDNVGNDTIVGGGGYDVLVSGTGADIFRYTAVSDSAINSGPDALLINAVAEDILQFTGLLAGTFSFVGAHTIAFAGGGNSSARFNDASDLLEIDTNGDSTADMGLTLYGVALADLSAADFSWS